ncbi:MAG: glycosyltransferase family 9 protein [Proteobacteria bacterium]|nr:glycosyltransferase family 9 protein [Pseudomonadota bacterium]
MIKPDAQVLVIVVARIGDTLLVTPALRALREAIPQGKLTVLAHPKRLEVLQHLPFIDTLAGITKTSATTRGWIGKSRFDLALVYGHDAALLRYALRESDSVIAFKQRDKALNGRLAHAVADPEVPQHAVLHRLSLLAPLGLASPPDLRLAYGVTDAERAEARLWLGAHVPAGRPLIGLQIASFPTKAHRDWPVSSFQELMGCVLATHTQAQFLLLGDKAAAEKAEPLLAACPNHAALAAGRMSLRRSAALMAELDLYIGVDTGPTHIAGALGMPMVALYHSAYPGRNLVPLQHPACFMIEHPLTGKSADTTPSMADITVAAVLQAAQDLLAGLKAGKRP